MIRPHEIAEAIWDVTFAIVTAAFLLALIFRWGVFA